MKDDSEHPDSPDGPRRARLWLLGLLVTAVLVWMLSEWGIPTGEASSETSIPPVVVDEVLPTPGGDPYDDRDPIRAMRS